MKLTHILIAGAAAVGIYLVAKRFGTPTPDAPKTGLAGVTSALGGLAQSIQTFASGPAPGSSPTATVPHGTSDTEGDFYERELAAAPVAETFADYGQQATAGVAPYSLYGMRTA